MPLIFSEKQKSGLVINQYDDKSIMVQQGIMYMPLTAEDIHRIYGILHPTVRLSEKGCCLPDESSQIQETETQDYFDQQL